MKYCKPAMAFLTAALLLPFCIAAQSAEDMQKRFPGKLAVFSNVTREVEIAYKSNEPYAKAFEVSEMMMLDDKANGMFNKDKVFHSSFNELKKVEAYTLVPDGNSMKKIKVSEFKTQSSPSGSVFYDDVKETSFDYPRMMKGSVAHVETEYYQKDIRFLTPFYFSNYLPVANAVYTVLCPEDMEVRYIIKNDDQKRIRVTETKKGRKKKLEFTATDISNTDYFANGTSMAYYAPHVIVYVANYKNEKESVPVFSSVEELYKWNSHFLEGINTEPDPALKKIADSICNGKTGDRAKAQAIYNWVQDHIKYVAFEEGLEGFIPRQAADVCRKRYGDCKDMASLLTAMLTSSGIKAHFVWIGTRSIPYTYSEVPLPITDNHMISAAYIDKEWIFLDATDPNCIFGFPSSGIQGKQALISISKDKFELVKVPVMLPERSMIIDSTFLTVDKNTVRGSSSVDYKGYFGSDLYNNLLFSKGDDERVYVRRRMAKGSNKFIMKDYKLTYTDMLNREANISAGFDIPDYAKSIGDEIYINLNLEKILNGSIIDTAKRKVAWESDFNYSIQQSHVLTIPDGYELSYLPKNSNLTSDVADLKIEYRQLPGKIVATQYYSIKKLYMQPVDFSKWNDMLSKSTALYKEQVVLKKK